LTSIPAPSECDPASYETCNTIAVNPATNRIYVLDINTNSVTAIDGDTKATTTIPVGLGASVIVLNPVTNKIYVSNGSESTVSVIDGETNYVTTVPVPAPSFMAVNPSSNQVYVVSGDGLTIIDGATNQTSSLPVTGFETMNITVNPATNKVYIGFYYGLSIVDVATRTVTNDLIDWDVRALKANPVTNTLYFTSFFSFDGNTGFVVSEQASQPIPLITTIKPLLRNQADSRTPMFHFAAESSFASSGLPVQSVYYQVDSWQGTWLRASGRAPRFSGRTPPLVPGTHILYAFATDGQEATSTGPAQTLSGVIAAYTFTVMK
jgi:DNA-binding beta-propeller fold protein YncE